MMHTRNCKKVHDFLNKDQFDIVRLYEMVRSEFGRTEVANLNQKLSEYFQMPSKNVRDYFEMLDARVAELKQIGGGEEMMQMQRQECFILANNFVSDDDTYSKTYLSRMVLPFTQVLRNRLEQDLHGKPLSELKYLVFNLHDTNLSNFLRFLGYWEKYGYHNHVKYASSIRLELFKKRGQKASSVDDYRLRVVFDNKEVHLPFCKEKYCTFAEYLEHTSKNLMPSLEAADEFCKV